MSFLAVLEGSTHEQAKPSHGAKMLPQCPAANGKCVKTTIASGVKNTRDSVVDAVRRGGSYL